MNRRSMIKAILAITALVSIKTEGATKRKCAVINHRCVGCGDCKLVCPTGALVLINGKAQVDSQKCIGCYLCSATCSYGALGRWTKEE